MMALATPSRPILQSIPFRHPVTRASFNGLYGLGDVSTIPSWAVWLGVLGAGFVAFEVWRYKDRRKFMGH